MQLTTFSRIKKLKSVHVNIEASYIEYCQVKVKMSQKMSNISTD